MMSKSVLNGRIGVCNSISMLNENECLEVIRLLRNVLGLDDLNQFVTKMFMDYSNNWTMDQIIQFENKIQPTLSNSQLHDNKSITNINKDVQFHLLRLPTDLIKKTSLYLNERDIFKFERCCRSFYQMINNTSYLYLSNNFKTFTIKNKTLEQMSQTQHSFFKYSKTKHVKLDCNTGLYVSDATHSEEIEQAFTKLRSKWGKAKQVCIHDGWFENMFKSIETLDIEKDCMVFLDQLPIEWLFDPNESHVNEICFNHQWNQSDHNFLKQYINKFETEYQNIQHKLEKQGKQMRQLTRAKHSGLGDHKGSQPVLYMSVQHLRLHTNLLCNLRGIRIDLNKNWLSRHYSPSLQKLSCDYNIKFDKELKDVGHNQENLKKSTLDLDKQENMNIETLRLRNFNAFSSCDICNDKIVIESLNLQNSLKDLMLTIRLTNMNNRTLNQWQNAIESIVKKEYFYNLEKVIILLTIARNDIDWIFTMLKANISLLKYQFKKFTIGLDIYSHYHVLEWNKEIDETYLNQLQALCKQNNKKQEIQDQTKQKYCKLIDEWSS